jgi:hypothetical protein
MASGTPYLVFAGPSGACLPKVAALDTVQVFHSLSAPDSGTQSFVSVERLESDRSERDPCRSPQELNDGCN